MNNIKQLLFIISICSLQIFLFIGCKKYEETNYFKCKIDCTNWEAAHGEGLGDYPLYAYLYADTSLQIYARGVGSFFISIHENLYVGRHEFRGCGNSTNCATYDNDNTMNYFSTDSVNTGYMNIETFDLKALIIKGTINFTGIYNDKSKVIKITDGTFSIPLQKHY